MVQGIPEYDNVPPLDRLEAINKLIDENPLLIGKERSHAGAFHFYGLIEENDDDKCQPNGDKEVARPNTNFISQGMGRRRRRCWSFRNRWSERLVLVRALHFLLPSIYSTGLLAALDSICALVDGLSSSSGL